MKSNDFFGVSYPAWQDTCEMFLNSPTNLKMKLSLSSYLQDYPFSRITLDDKKEIESKKFYNSCIASGAIFFNDSVTFTTRNFVTKNSGGFRDSQLLSPFLFLIEQSIGMEIYHRYLPSRKDDENLMAFYSGDFSQKNILYKNQYNDFSKSNNLYADEGYPYFIKTDLSDYFSNINLNKLMSLVNKNCSRKFTPVQQKTIIDILKYCGDNKFPLVQNSVASSFLATIVYLDQIDTKLANFINSLDNISNYKLIRYVDDLYIWLRPKSSTNLNQEYNDIRSMYSSLLHDYGLTLNTKKTSFHESKDINEQLKKNLYEEFFDNNSDDAVADFLRETDWSNNIQNFINDLANESQENKLNKESFENIIANNFKPKDMIEYTGEEVLKYIVYDNNSYLKKGLIISELSSLLTNQGINFIYLAPQLLTNMILNTATRRNKNIVIRSLLNQLFIKAKTNNINAYDVEISIYYLLYTNFRHEDLKRKIIKAYYPSLYSYIDNFCCHNFFDIFVRNIKSRYFKIIKGDWKTYYLYFNYKVEMKKESYMEAYAYFKTYFDRMTALIASYVSKEPLNVRKYYSVKNITKVYNSLTKNETEPLIKRANAIRDKNPLIHSTSEMLGWHEDGTKTLIDIIQRLNNLIKQGIQNIQDF